MAHHAHFAVAQDRQRADVETAMRAKHAVAEAALEEEIASSEQRHAEKVAAQDKRHAYLHAGVQDVLRFPEPGVQRQSPASGPGKRTLHLSPVVA